MECPFPGMDPYVERPAIWADFHDRLIPAISAALQPLLRPRCAALVQSERPVRPDVRVVESSRRRRRPISGVAVLAMDQPIVFELSDDEVRQPYIQIVEPAAGNRLITAIEVLSPDNKLSGPGRRQYLRKRRELWAGRANLVEIDLLRAGKPTFRMSADELARLPAWRYLATARRRSPRRQEVYPIALETRLPTIGIPLLREDPDVPLDLQASFTRCWQEGPYPELLRYDEPPPGTLTAEEIAWCEERLRQAGLRPAHTA
jgi:Protein of unknown function (DUF4058)